MTESKPSLLDLTTGDIKGMVLSLGEPSFRAFTISDWVYKKLAGSFSEMTDLPLRLRKYLNENFQLTRLTPVIDLMSSDNLTRKVLFNLPGNVKIETVLMSYHTRNTLCVSTQAGCALGCVFCATGQAGLQRNISAGEIVEQVLYFEKILRKSRRRLTNLVFMGMGEPFANYSEVVKSITILTDPACFDFGSRRITVSTVGIVPMIEKFAEDKPQVNLAVSLHAATDELRSELMPVNKRYPIEILINACRNYVQKTNRRISFEWALIRDVNDTPEQAGRLAELLRGMLCHVNLIPLNHTHGYSGRESSAKKIKLFRDILTASGIPNTVRLRRGIDINAGCGQLNQKVTLLNEYVY